MMLPAVKPNYARLLLFLGGVNVLVIVVMQMVGQDLKPGGIVPFEFAGTSGNAQRMVAAWQQQGVMPQLFFLIGFDYLFMITYASFLWVACQQSASRVTGGTAKFFLFVGWLQPAAAALDAIENFSLYQSAIGAPGELWPQLAFACAAPKFLFVLAALLVWISAGVFLRPTRA
jgi:hypothetical protein